MLREQRHISDGLPIVLLANARKVLDVFGWYVRILRMCLYSSLALMFRIQALLPVHDAYLPVHGAEVN